DVSVSWGRGPGQLRRRARPTRTSGPSLPKDRFSLAVEHLKIGPGLLAISHVDVALAVVHAHTHVPAAGAQIDARSRLPLQVQDPGVIDAVVAERAPLPALRVHDDEAAGPDDPWIPRGLPAGPAGRDDAPQQAKPGQREGEPLDGPRSS